VVAVGYKQPGTSVPMLARLDGAQVRWTSEIPSTDPLTSSSEDKLIGLSDRAAFVIYEPRSSALPRLAGFDLADGHRLWEVEVTSRNTAVDPVAVIATGAIVLVATWGSLQAFDQQDGTPRFTIGNRS
jgi:outer membrane protein assembly factor BamB